MAADLLMSSVTHDLVVVDGQLQLTDSEGLRIGQRISQKLLTFSGEWFANAVYGMPYYANVLGAPPDTSLLAEAFRPTLSTELATIISLTATVTGRQLTLSFLGTVPNLSGGTLEIGGSLNLGLEGALVVDGITITVDGVPIVVIL